MQKPEGFRVKASEGEVVVLYFEPSATQNLKSSGFPEGETTWQNRPHPSNSPMEVSKNLSFCYDFGNNCGPLSNLCHVVYATKGFILDQRAWIFSQEKACLSILRCSRESRSRLPSFSHRKADHPAHHRSDRRYS